MKLEDLPKDLPQLVKFVGTRQSPTRTYDAYPLDIFHTPNDILLLGVYPHSPSTILFSDAFGDKPIAAVEISGRDGFNSTEWGSGFIGLRREDQMEVAYCLLEDLELLKMELQQVGSEIAPIDTQEVYL